MYLYETRLSISGWLVSYKRVSSTSGIRLQFLGGGFLLYGCLKLVHFSKKSGRWSSVGPKILTFVSHCLANFQPIMGCLIPNFKLKYKISENIKVDRVDTVVFNLHQIKHQVYFFGTPGRFWDASGILALTDLASSSFLGFVSFSCSAGLLFFLSSPHSGVCFLQLTK